MTNATFVTIGRNVGSAPLNDLRWSLFQDDVKECVTVIFGPADIESVHIGTGEWEGVPEESAIVSFIHFEFDPVDIVNHLQWLKDALSEVALRFGQDTIALSVGASELVPKMGA